MGLLGVPGASAPSAKAILPLRRSFFQPSPFGVVAAPRQHTETSAARSWILTSTYSSLLHVSFIQATQICNRSLNFRVPCTILKSKEHHLKQTSEVQSSIYCTRKQGISCHLKKGKKKATSVNTDFTPCEPFPVFRFRSCFKVRHLIQCIVR